MKVSDKKIEEALRACGVCKTHAAKMLGVSLNALCGRIKSSKHLTEVFDEVKAETTDLAESSLIQLIREKNVAATIWYLKTIGKDRGYTESVDNLGDLDQINESLKLIGERLPV